MAPALSSKDRALHVFSDISSYSSLLSACTSEWTDLQNHFSQIEASLRQKLDDLAEKEKLFGEKISEMSQVLDKREEAISVREQTSLARVEEQKKAAMSALEEERRKYLASGGASSAAKTAPAVTGKESMAKRDLVTAVAATTETKGDANGASKLSSFETKPSMDEVRVRPEIKSLCDNMDGDGLTKYIVEHRNKVAALRNELLLALQSAIDPSRLVLKALEGYHLLELEPNRGMGTEASANRRSCIMLLECLAEVLADPVLGVDHPVVPSNIKDSAKEVANLWRSKRDIHADAASENSLDTQAFLQLLATFGIASEFNDDELLKLVTAVARRKQTPALCKSLGLTAKVPDIVETLNKDGKQIEALGFAHFFGIMDKVQPVPMLKAYLKEARKAAQALAQNATNPKTAQNNSTAKELSAIKAVLRAVEDYGLSAQYPTEALLKRVAQLDKAKPEKKKDVTPVKTQIPAKKPRLSGGYAGARPHAAPDAGYNPGMDRVQYGSGAISAYGLSSQSIYERQPQASYSSLYGAGSRSPGSLPSSYLYSSDLLAPSAYTSASAYSNPSGTYGTYPYSDSLLGASAYPPSYLR